MDEKEKPSTSPWLALVVSLLALLLALGTSVFSGGRAIEARPTQAQIDARLKEASISREEWGRVCEALRQIERRLERIEKKIDERDRKP